MTPIEKMRRIVSRLSTPKLEEVIEGLLLRGEEGRLPASIALAELARRTSHFEARNLAQKIS